MGRPRLKRGERRIDAAIDHLAQYGFPRPQIPQDHQQPPTVLLTIYVSIIQLYGRDGWVFLEEGSYRVVLDKLLEEQGQLEKQEEAAEDKATPENDMEVSQAVHSEVPTESQSTLEQQASPNSLPPQKLVLPVPPATRAARARPPCYGWINGPRLTIIPQKDVPNPAETLPSKRKRPTRWDVP
ncbi:hypothetical protein PVAP13_2NG292200 [Panicum virgatum]|uniref:WIYLD domain-containing protein n=1 Tax=Panicum virgatum TaxID=38727 RepID=A0A8T0VH07_PANVG|nr:hypothetical protein PVAP13_2NG292200 [Panicum virgatum]